MKNLAILSLLGAISVMGCGAGDETESFESDAIWDDSDDLYHTSCTHDACCSASVCCATSECRSCESYPGWCNWIRRQSVGKN